MKKTADDNCPTTSEGPRHLYVHVPFCARICPYCAFYKEQAGSEQRRRFCAALIGELKANTQRQTLRPTTIFFGGGTPTALSSNQLDGILRDFRDYLDLSSLREWTLEANPGSVSSRKAECLVRGGVTRISLGVQSWDDDHLRTLGREHDADLAETSFTLLRQAGFQNLSIDLMFGLPNQTSEQWARTLEKTISLEPEHISTYCLTYEEDTPFFLRHQRGELRQDSDADAESFELTMQTLESAGYRQYETSNYARPGFESVHNAAYWAGEDYLGLGPSAFSTVGFRRWQNVADFRAYADRVLAGESPVHEVEELSVATKKAESLALSLRTRGGVPMTSLQEKSAETAEFLALGLMQQSGETYVLTHAGKMVADSVAAAYI